MLMSTKNDGTQEKKERETKRSESILPQLSTSVWYN